MKPAEVRLAAQLAEGSPGAALTLNVEEAAELRRRVFQLLSDAAEARSSSALFAQTAQLAKGQKLPFESVLELFYSLLTDLLELSAGCANLKLRNPTLAKELAALGKRVDPQWVSQAVTGLDELGSRLRRNVNRQLGLDAVVLSLSLKHPVRQPFAGGVTRTPERFPASNPANRSSTREAGAF